METPNPEARLEELRAEARYRRERLGLYKARMYGGRAGSQFKLRELERASEGAAARLRRAGEMSSPGAQPDSGEPATRASTLV